MQDRAPRLLVIVALLAVVGGCGTQAAEDDSTETSSESGPSGEFESLIDHVLWVQIDAQDDPLADHRPAEFSCGVAGWYVEKDHLEVTTLFCNYLAVAQPSLVPIQEGREIRLGFYHFDLTAADPALAHVAILVNGALLWEQDIEIPGAAAVYELAFESPLSAPAGSELVFHLHNHGQNTWALQNLSAEQ